MYHGDIVNNNTLIGISLPTFSDEPGSSTSFGWEQRAMSFMALESTMIFKFLPADDDPDQTQDTPFSGLRMGIDNIYIELGAIPVVNLGMDVTLCQGETLTLDATLPNATYLWQDNSTDSIYNVTEEGTYWVDVSVNDTTVTDTINVSYQDLPTIDLGNDMELCDGENLLLDVNTLDGTYSWQDNSTEADLNVTQTGLYWVEVTVNNCSTIDSIYVNFNSIPIDLGVDTTLCDGQSLLLDVTVSNGIYLWQDSTTIPFVNVTEPGIYSVEVTVDNCNTYDSIDVNFNPFPIIDIGIDTTLCPEELLVLDAAMLEGSYLWQDNSTEPLYEVTETGLYWVEVTVNNCSTLDTINVDFIPTPIDLGMDTTICEGEQLWLDASTTNGTYLWQDGSTEPLHNASQSGLYSVDVTFNNCSITESINVGVNALPIINIGNDTTLCQGELLLLDANVPGGNYIWQDSSTDSFLYVTQAGLQWVEVTVNNCISADSVNVAFNPLPIIDLGVDTTLCNEDYLTLNATTSDANYLWQDNSIEPTFIVTNEGIYWVEVTNNNCSQIDSLAIIMEDCVPLLLLPNVITPNSDGLNDSFRPIKSERIKSMRTFIYNRWGSKIYETGDLEINWNGQDVNDGVYFWLIDYTSLNGTKNRLNGHITLIK